MVDGGAADDKIIAVLEGDFVWGSARDVAAVPEIFLERLRHYFLTYKLVPGVEPHFTIERVYGRDHALDVIRAAMADYDEAFPGR
jgi:inorganic pyrophosphatase